MTTPDPYTGLYNNSNGGTEQMARRLQSSLSDEIKNKVQIICSRVNKFHPDKAVIFWAHDLFNDPEAFKLRDPVIRDKIDAYVFVSDWQRITYQAAHNIPYHKTHVIRNAIERMDDVPFFSGRATTANRIERLIYHTTPHRGLEILVPTFIKLLETYPYLTLDVYSSFEVYGWKERDVQYQQLFDICKNHPSIKYHGTVPNTEIRRALTKADLFAYPCIWPETSCLAVIEALMSGTFVLTNNFAALPETTSGFETAMTYNYHEDINKHAEQFYRVLDFIVGTVPKKNHVYKFPHELKTKYDWDHVKYQWKELLTETIYQYETRKKNGQQFRITTG